jgi:flavin reductase (DIM6/NTAB) family NADH-FMN oxidoreductase RutF
LEEAAKERAGGTMPQDPAKPACPVEAAFRQAMRCFASTVTVITGGNALRRHGMTATAVTSLAMNPPSLLVCLNRETLLNDIMIDARHFCVNVLQTEQEDISMAFSGKFSAQERFGIGDWDYTDAGLPFLRTAQVNIFCRKSAALPYGSHTILIGEVEDVRINEGPGPLVYHDGRYCAPGARPGEFA